LSQFGGVSVPQIQVIQLPSLAQEQHLAVTSRVVFQRVLLTLSKAFLVGCARLILNCVHGLKLGAQALLFSRVRLRFPIDL